MSVAARALFPSAVAPAAIPAILATTTRRRTSLKEDSACELHANGIRSGPIQIAQLVRRRLASPSTSPLLRTACAPPRDALLVDYTAGVADEM